MITLSVLLLSVTAITVDPDTICVPSTASGKIEKRYKHCKKGDLIYVSKYELKLLCDFKGGEARSGQSRNPISCIYRGKPRLVKLSPSDAGAKKNRKEKKEEMKNSGRKKL